MLTITPDQASTLPPEARRALAALCVAMFPEYLSLRGGDDAEPVGAAGSLAETGEPVDVPPEQILTLLAGIDPKSEAFLRCLAEHNGTAGLGALQQAIDHSYVGGIRSGLTRRIRAMVRDGEIPAQSEPNTAVLFAVKHNTFRLSPVTTAALREHFGF
ncbi:hypothetical protein [Azospirillum griseum]|uniref:Uncharacterized protein n=1 Tax=Azospirillum griseum TaxID=2496639 RepID=A0A431V9X3_9PROT|nr:hypothetical protein [Azospirillum griseum]RTR12736.1 hypothetical protein EJ903_25285 [Azospirillum griseum]